MPAPGYVTNTELTQVEQPDSTVEGGIDYGIEITMDYQPGVNQYKVLRRSTDPQNNAIVEFSISQPNPAPAPIAHVGGYGPRVSVIDWEVPMDFPADYYVWATNTIGASKKRGPYRITPSATQPPFPVTLEGGGTGGSPTEPHIADIPIFSDTFDRPDQPYNAEGTAHLPAGTPPFNNSAWYLGEGAGGPPLGGSWRVMNRQGYLYQNTFRPGVVVRPDRLVRADVPSSKNAKVSMRFSDNPLLGGVYGTDMGLLVRYSPSKGTGLIFTEKNVKFLNPDGRTTMISDQYDLTDLGPFRTGDEMAVACFENSLKVYKNGFILANIASSVNYEDGVTYGIYSTNHTVKWDDFYVYPYVVPAQEDGFQKPNDGTIVPEADPNGIPYDPTVDPDADTGGDWYTDPAFPPGSVVRWRMIDVWKRGKAPYVYTFHINPNEGGSPQVSKNMNIVYNVGPNRGGIIQEGQSSVPTLDFSGVILTQAHYEALEYWYDKRILIELRDDLGRRFRGVFSAFNPQRERRAYNPWYHKFSAQFTIYGYRTASGQFRYGRY